MTKLHVVIPIGVGAENTPIQQYLETSVNSILNQTCNEIILTVAADSNIPQRCIDFLNKKKVEIKWFDSFTYFRHGGIWKKIADTWRDTNTNYIAFMHYDDIWDLNKAKIQIDLMEEQNLNGSFSEVYICDNTDSIISKDQSFSDLSINTIGTRTCAFAHSTIIARHALQESGIFQYENNWAANFEDLWALYIHKLKTIKKANGAKMFWRTHDHSVSATFKEESEIIQYQRNITKYTLTDTLKDAYKIDLDDIKKEIIKSWS